MPAVTLGKMDRRITIQKLIQGIGPTYREPTETWATWATVWANVYSGSSRELDAARQISVEVDTQFQIRWLEGLSESMRIVYQGVNYHIYNIQEVGRRDRINIFAKAKQP